VCARCGGAHRCVMMSAATLSPARALRKSHRNSTAMKILVFVVRGMFVERGLPSMLHHLAMLSW
jgi:hypothetical protein